MVFIAFFLVVFSFNYFKLSFNLDGTKKSNTFSLVEDSDWDNDGLTNKEESFWNTDPNNRDSDEDSYLDGEEVASGHDPLIAGPDDFIDNSNLTKKLSGLTLAGIYEGSLKPDNPNYGDSLDQLATIIADDAVDIFKIDLSKVKLNIINSNKDSEQKYIEEFSEVYEKILVAFINQMGSLEENIIGIGSLGFSDKKISKNFEGASIQYKEVYKNLSEMSVPQNWKANHIGILKLAGELSQASQAVFLGKDDPIKATVGLNKIIQLWGVLPGVTEAYSKKIERSGLDPENTIFK